jgi:hypothetical protein
VNIYQKLGAIYQRTKGKFTQDTRNSQAALTGIITLAVRFISIGSGLLSISITARYLGKEEFGVWLLLITFMNWVSLADVGLTNSLTNILATALAKDDRQTAKQSVASAFFPMLGLGIFLLAIALISSLFIAWEGVLNLHLSPSSAGDTRMAIVVAMCLFAISIPLSIPRLAREKAIAVERADRIICVSENTHKDAIELLNIDESKISTIHIAATPDITLGKEDRHMPQIDRIFYMLELELIIRILIDYWKLIIIVKDSIRIFRSSVSAVGLFPVKKKHKSIAINWKVKSSKSLGMIINLPIFIADLLHLFTLPYMKALGCHL